MAALDWLVARPIAHRGLHDESKGIVENTVSACAAAVAANYAMEVDLQITSDGEAMVHHDDDLGRLTDGAGPLAAKSAAELKKVRFKNTADPMMSLGDLCDLVAGRSTMVIELKSRFDGDLRVAQRAAEVLKSYRGPVALMSFDPDLVAACRAQAPRIARGIIAERHYNEPDWANLSSAKKFNLTWFLHAPKSRPMFVAYWVKELPATPVSLARRLFGWPVLTWTVRSSEDQARAARYADQMIFEGFRP